MSNQGGSKKEEVISPIKFSAGGKRSPQKKKGDGGDSGDNSSPDPTQENHEIVAKRPTNNSLEWIQSGLLKKKSPLSIQSWIATVLTLDGRDKFTKVLQYSSRLLSWYFAGLAAAAAAAGSSSARSNGINAHGSSSMTQLYQALSTNFNSLYKSLVTSRKAFRIGRSFIEWDKIQSMGWGDYLGYFLRHPLAEVGGRCDDDDNVEDVNSKVDGVGKGGEHNHHHSLSRYDTHPIPEGEEEEGEEGEDNDDVSWNGEEEGENATAVDEKKDEAATHNQPLSQNSKKKNKTKVISRPGRPVLPSRISSNIGWGPSNTATSSAAAADSVINKDISPSPSNGGTHHPPPPPRTVSEMGRRMYRPYPSQSSTSFGSYTQLKGTSLSAKTLSSPPPPLPSTPAWKLIGGTLKLLGLMGFWAFDNLSFLTSSGFLDPIHLRIAASSSSSSSSSSSFAKSNATIRSKRQQWASENAARCYFMGGLAGLYVNLRSFWIHKNGALAEARRMYQDKSTSTSDDNDDRYAHRNSLKKIEQKHFELFLALLKSICDVMVFSNNPGIDLHLKLRGKKNHEGLHCLCGLISASTVLYSNFPNAE